MTAATGSAVQAEAHRVAFLVDNRAYFSAAASAMRKARRSIMIVGWMFDPRTVLEPERGGAPIGDLLLELAAQQSAPDVHVLVWRPAFPVSIGRSFMARRARRRFRRGRIHYHLDGRPPLGASHHQKLVVVDDAVAFCGGGDFMPNRWDTPDHADHCPHRSLPSGKPYDPRHEVMAVVDGPAAAALGQMVRERWQLATGERLPAVHAAADPWPDNVEADAEAVPLTIARTMPAWSRTAERRETEALLLEAVRTAREWLYLECQYFASRDVTAALASRLAEPSPPEVVVVCPRHSPSAFDRFAMDPARDLAVRRLRSADRRHRFRAYWPRAAGGTPIVVHSKVTAADGRLLHVGSANLNNRSMGFDSECGLVIDGVDAIAGTLVDRLLAEHLGAPRERVRAVRLEAGLIRAIERLNRPTGRGLAEVDASSVGPLGRLIAAGQLFDPKEHRDAWRPWKRW